MNAKIEKSFELSQEIEKVWSFLSNPSKVVTCVPGASLTEEIDDKNYKGEVSMKFGPVAVKYDGQITLEELDHDNFRMVMVGKGMDSKGQGSASMTMKGKLEPSESGTTLVSYSMDVSVVGKLAQFGSRLIVDVSDQLAEQFIANFKRALESPQTEGSEQPADQPAETSLNALALFWGLVVRFFKRAFGGAR